ncbi:MAG: hypothetical protein Q4B42_03570 [Oscillospiraceae bacterium]|nr:hypothetical protein [Oscillospiraceae bacterium]
MKKLGSVLIGAAALGAAAAFTVYYLQKKGLIDFNVNYEGDEDELLLGELEEDGEAAPDAEDRRRKSIFFEPLEIVNRQLQRDGVSLGPDEEDELSFGEISLS